MLLEATACAAGGDGTFDCNCGKLIGINIPLPNPFESNGVLVVVVLGVRIFNGCCFG